MYIVELFDYFTSVFFQLYLLLLLLAVLRDDMVYVPSLFYIIFSMNFSCLPVFLSASF